MTLEQIQARTSAANTELDRVMANGTPCHDWLWHIPADPEKDTDLILSAALQDNTKLLAAVDATLTQLDAVDNRPEEIGRPRKGVLLHTKDLRAAITGALA
jgi:hypothetical protein